MAQLKAAIARHDASRQSLSSVNDTLRSFSLEELAAAGVLLGLRADVAATSASRLLETEFGPVGIYGERIIALALVSPSCATRVRSVMGMSEEELGSAVAELSRRLPLYSPLGDLLETNKDQ